LTAHDLPGSLDETSEDLLGTCDPELDESEIELSLAGPQESIADTISAYETAGLSTELRALGPYDGTQEPTDELTDRQREVIQTAFDMGYFEVPRSVSADEIADELGLDQSTVVEHLQRAERNLLGQFL
jgi:predicted DNA binding protein